MAKLKERILGDTNKKDVANFTFMRQIEFQIVYNSSQINEIEFAQRTDGAMTGRSSKVSSKDDVQSMGSANDEYQIREEKITVPEIPPSSIEQFIKSQFNDNAQAAPPIRILVVGDDKHFNKFITEYVHLLSLDEEQNYDSISSNNSQHKGKKPKNSALEESKE